MDYLDLIDMEENKYENIIAKYTSEQLICEQAILDKEETNLYIKKKAMKNEIKRRLENGNYIK